MQTIIAKTLTSYLSEELHANIKIKGVDIAFFKGIVLQKIVIADLQNDTILYAPKLQINIGKLSIKKHKLKINKLILDNAYIALKKYKDSTDMNYSFIVDYFSSTDTIRKDTTKWELSCSALEISDTRFIYQNQNKYFVNEGIDYSNISISDLNTKVKNIKIVNDTVYADINFLSAKETSGFVLNELKGKIKISSVELKVEDLKIITQKSDILLNFSFNYNDFYDFNDFINNISIYANIKPSTFNLCDVGYFAPVLFRMDNKLKISGDIKGKVNNFKAKNFQFDYGNSTKFSGKIRFNGLPDIKETFVHLAIKDFTTSKDDIGSLKLPVESNRIILPNELQRLGNIEIKGYFTGFYNDFVSNAVFSTDLGKISTDILLKKNYKSEIVEYNGNIAAEHFNIGTFFLYRNM